MKKLCSETLKTLIIELNRPSSQAVNKRETYQKKAINSILLQYNNIGKVKIFCVLRDLLTRCSEWETRNRRQIIFRKVLTIDIQKTLIKRSIFVTLIKLRLDFLFADLSQHFRIYFYLLDMGRLRTFIFVVKLKVIQPQPKHKRTISQIQGNSKENFGHAQQILGV